MDALPPVHQHQGRISAAVLSTTPQVDSGTGLRDSWMCLTCSKKQQVFSWLTGLEVLNTFPDSQPAHMTSHIDIHYIQRQSWGGQCFLQEVFVLKVNFLTKCHCTLDGSLLQTSPNLRWKLQPWVEPQQKWEALFIRFSTEESMITSY